MNGKNWSARTALAAVSLAALTALAGCAADPGEGPSTGEDLGVAVFLSVSANSYEQAQADGVKDAVSELGAGAVTVYDGGFDSLKQVGQIQDATTSGRFGVFVIEPIDGASVVQALTAAAAQGIAVVCITNACGPETTTIDLQFEGQAGLVASDYAKAASQLAERAVEACEGVDPCKVFYLNGDSAYSSDRAAKEAFAAVMAAAPANVDYVGSQDGQYDTATGRSVAQSELQRTPDLDVIVSLADQQTLGVDQAIEAAGLTGEIRIISFGGSEQAITAVVEGRWFGALVTVPRSIGSTAATIGIKTVRGEAPAEVVVDAGTLSSLPGGFLTPENAAGFTPQWTS